MIKIKARYNICFIISDLYLIPIKHLKFLKVYRIVYLIIQKKKLYLSHYNYTNINFFFFKTLGTSFI